MLTCGAEGPGDVEVEVVGSVDGHVQVLVGLEATKQHNLHFKLSVHTRQIRQTYTLNLSCLVYSPRAGSPSA